MVKFRFHVLFICMYLLIHPQWMHGQYINEEPFAHTFSIVAFDPETGDMGIAVQSHWFSVGTTVAWGEAGAGIIATQAVVNIGFGPNGLALLKKGISPDSVLHKLLQADPARDIRQLAILDTNGNIAVNTGKMCVAEAGHQQGRFYSVQANTAESKDVWKMMAAAYEQTDGPLAARMIAALEAAQDAGGDIRGKQSACLLVVRKKPTGKIWLDRKVDIRVEDNPDPIKELKRIYTIKTAYDAVNLGYYYLEKNDPDAADEAFNKAEKLNPGNSEMKFWYAVELANKGMDDRALDVFKTVFRQDPVWKIKMLPRIVNAGVLNVPYELLKRIEKL
ncbi:DUF1028 domain-containing protein [Chitinophaga sancti]|uniref:DUF1028 domain-containing protein n=1 Tax=Chitinophaga sancti TaxID=1004 RepID=UPI002A765069|nr:DUF1028 domain-containing protein [Chitinophaga sancti]WPQ66065.1 DUF1028 domain-containing protein [Chitinophaga sancti]